MNKKHNKRSLILSLLAMLLCITMLVGSTFAWFTDTANTNVNTITAGNLDLQLLDADGVTLEGDTLTLAGTNVSEYIEPNGTYEFEPVTIKNAGNVGLKYKFSISGIEGDAGLLKVLSWEYIIDSKTGTDFDSYEGTLTPNTSHTLKIRFTMNKDAGNEYKNMTLSGIAINVVATQATGDYDSSRNDYDASAEYPEFPTEPEDPTVRKIASAQELRNFVEAVNSGSLTASEYAEVKTITLAGNIDLSGENWTPINGWNGVLNGYTIDGNGYAIQNMTVDGGDVAGFISNNASSLTIKNLTFENAYVKTTDGNSKYAGVVMGKNYSKVTLENVSVKNSQVRCTWQCGGLVGFAEDNGPTFVNCSIEDSFVGGSNCTSGAFFGLGVVDIVVDGGYVKNVNLYTDMAPGLVGYIYGHTLTNNGCVVENVEVVSTYPD